MLKTRWSQLKSVLRLSRISRKDWIMVGLITLITIIFFAPVWLKGGWIPAGGGDLIAFMWPSYRFASRMLRSGHLPLWNPHYDSGMPFFADNQMAVLYPLNLVVTVLTDMPFQALEGLVLFHVWLTGILMYVCLRHLNHDMPIEPIPAAAGAVAWMLSDIFISELGLVNIITATTWLPLIFLGLWRGLRDRSWQWALVSAVTLALNTLAGHGQITYFAAILAGCLSLWWVIIRLFDSWRSAIQTAGLAALIGVASLALSIVGWLPLLGLLPYTERAAMGYELASFGSLSLTELIALVFLRLAEGPVVGHIGVVALAFAALGLVMGLAGWNKQRSVTAFLGLLAAFSILMALGSNFPLHRLAYDFLPGIRAFRIPSRFVTLSCFSTAMLAAFGINAIRSVPIRGAIAVLVALELVFSGIGSNVQYGDPRTGYFNTDVVQWLQNQPGEPHTPYRIEGSDARWQPDSAMFWGSPLYDIHGYFNPLSLSHYEAFYWSVGARGTPLYNFLGAKYIIADGPPGDANFIPAYVSTDGPTIYLNLGALPLVHLVYEAITVTSMENGWNQVHRNEWDPTSLVYVENGPAMQAERPPDARVSIETYDPNRLVYTVNTSAPAYLVLSEVDYPGWRATIDGKPVPIYRANLAFRAILIEEPGEHTVRVMFRPMAVYVGLVISGAAWAGVLAVCYLTSRRSGAEPLIEA